MINTEPMIFKYVSYIIEEIVNRQFEKGNINLIYYFKT